MNSTAIAELASRLPKAAFSYTKLVSLLGMLSEGAQTIADRRTEADQDRTLSRKGRDDAVRKVAAVAGTRAVIAETEIGYLQANIENARAALVALPAIDKGDLSAVLLRDRLQSFVLGLEPTQRLAFLAEHADDDILVQAAMALPSYVSGIGPDERQMILGRRAAAKSPSRVAEIEAELEGIATVKAGVALFRQAIDREAPPPSPTARAA